MKNPWILVLFGIIRHALGALGGWLVAKGFLEPEEAATWMPQAVEWTVGVLMILGATVWSAINKRAVWEWLQRALHITPPPAAEPETAKRRAKDAMQPFVPVLIIGLLGGLLAAGCSTIRDVREDPPSIADLIPLDRITDPETAQRALLLLQDVRVASRDWLAKKVKADGSITEEELAAIEKFDEYDAVFTNAWAFADQVVQRWKATGQNDPARFSQNYGAMMELVANPNGMRDYRDLAAKSSVPMTFRIY